MGPAKTSLSRQQEKTVPWRLGSLDGVQRVLPGSGICVEVKRARGTTHSEPTRGSSAQPREGRPGQERGLHRSEHGRLRLTWEGDSCHPSQGRRGLWLSRDGHHCPHSPVTVESVPNPHSGRPALGKSGVLSPPEGSLEHLGFPGWPGSPRPSAQRAAVWPAWRGCLEGSSDVANK